MDLELRLQRAERSVKRLTRAGDASANSREAVEGLEAIDPGESQTQLEELLKRIDHLEQLSAEPDPSRATPLWLWVLGWLLASGAAFFVGRALDTRGS